MLILDVQEENQDIAQIHRLQNSCQGDGQIMTDSSDRRKERMRLDETAMLNARLSLP